VPAPESSKRRISGKLPRIAANASGDAAVGTSSAGVLATAAGGVLLDDPLSPQAVIARTRTIANPGAMK